MLEKNKLNKCLTWFREGIRWRWERFYHFFIKSKLTDILIFLRLSHQFFIYREHGVRFFIYRKQIERSQWYSKKRIRDYQNKRFKKIVLHAYRNVPYYKRIFDVYGINPRDIDQISRIPILDKDTVRSNTPDLLARNMTQFRPVKHRTSGSTGRPLEIYVDKNLHTFGANLVWRHFNWGGYTFSKRLVTFESPFGFHEGKLNKKDLWRYTRPTNILRINTAVLEGENIKAICDKIAEFNPEYIRSYPSFAYTMALYLAKHKTKIRPKAIFTSSEKLYPKQKQFIEQAFGCKVYQFYGMWEYVMFAYTCSHGNLHVTPELGILEVLKNGKKCKKGETGELVCTTLHNYSMPLIRYTTKDYGYIEDIECPCGRKTEVLSVVGCRDKDLIVTKNGFVNVMSGTPWFNQKSRIKQIQFYQEKKGEVIVRLVPEEKFSNTDLNNLRESLANYFNDSVDLNFELVNKIPRTRAGKYKYVESKVPIEF